MTQAALKDVVKQALIELIDERREAITSVLAEAIEDAALAAAIREGRKSAKVSKASVLKELKARR